MKRILSLILAVVFGVVGLADARATKKGPMKPDVKKPVVLEIKIHELKTVLGTLKVRYLSFGHEHSSSRPGEEFSATTGLYEFELTDGKSKTNTTFYTGAHGESNPIQFWERYEMKVVKTSADQRSVTLRIVRLK